MKKTALFMLCGLLLCSYAASAQAQATAINPWTLMPQAGQLNYRDVVHQSSAVYNHLWVVGDNGVIKYMSRDVNGVEYWNPPNSLGITNASDYDFNSLCFMKGDVKYGWLVGEKKSDYSGILLSTVDYGYNWVLVTKLPLLPAGTAFKSVSFADDGNGYIACGNGIILMSSDRGVNWMKIPTPVPTPDGVSIWYQSIYTDPTNSAKVWVVGDNYGIVAAITDGGSK